MTSYHQADNGMIATVIRDKRAAAERLRKTHPHIAQRMEEEAAALEYMMKGGKRDEPRTDH